MGFIGLIFAPFILAGLLAFVVFIVTVIAILFLVSLILFITGLVLRKNHKKASKVLLILAAVFFGLFIAVTAAVLIIGHLL